MQAEGPGTLRKRVHTWGDGSAGVEEAGVLQHGVHVSQVALEVGRSEPGNICERDAASCVQQLP